MKQLLSGQPVAPDKSDSDNNIGRRGFLKSLFGMPAVAETGAPAPAKAASPRSAAPVFIWGDLKNGNVGFPTGLGIGSGMPGSLMKIVASAALHEEALISPNHIYDCLGHIEMHKQTFSCLHAHGKVDLTNAIAQSCNVFFVQAAQHLPTKTFLHYAEKFGLNSPCAGRASGAFPANADGPSWRYVLGLSPDMQPSSLQILRMSALVAKKGHAPFLHSAEDPSDGKGLILELSEGTWHRLQQGMELSSRVGTSHKLDPENKLHIAAKTGTVPDGQKFLSWVTGYFPAENPKHVFVLNTLAGTSQEAAIPQAHKILFATEWP